MTPMLRPAGVRAEAAPEGEATADEAEEAAPPTVEATLPDTLEAEAAAPEVIELMPEAEALAEERVAVLTVEVAGACTSAGSSKAWLVLPRAVHGKRQLTDEVATPFSTVK